jgi:hypothetical protein
VGEGAAGQRRHLPQVPQLILWLWLRQVLHLRQRHRLRQVLYLRLHRHRFQAQVVNKLRWLSWVYRHRDWEVIHGI